MLRKVLRISARILLWGIGFIVAYALLMLLLSYIPVGPSDTEAPDVVTIYVKSNGVHTDIVVPAKNDYKDWTNFARPEHSSGHYPYRYIGFGWGDRDFYLNTPQWSDLKVSTALHAITYTGESIMHTTFLKSINQNEYCVSIDISAHQYLELIQYIERGFRLNGAGFPVLIPESAYGQSDSFYEGVGRYSLVYTCNSWTNEGLKAAGQKAALWTLTDTGVLRHHRIK